MLYVLMTICGERYGVESASVVEVIPAVSLTKVHDLNRPWLCGEFNYHGSKASVVDGGLLISERPSEVSLSTRIAMLRVDQASEHYSLGFMAEEMTETVKCVIGDIAAYRQEEQAANSIEIASDRASKRGFKILNTQYIYRVAISL